MTLAHHVFAQIAQSQTGTVVKIKPTITTEQWHQWQQQAVVDILQGQRYGQSFCNYFGITDNILYYERSQQAADRYIGFNYIS